MIDVVLAQKNNLCYFAFLLMLLINAITLTFFSVLVFRAETWFYKYCRYLCLSIIALIVVYLIGFVFNKHLILRFIMTVICCAPLFYFNKFLQKIKRNEKRINIVSVTIFITTILQELLFLYLNIINGLLDVPYKAFIWSFGREHTILYLVSVIFNAAFIIILGYIIYTKVQNEHIAYLGAFFEAEGISVFMMTFFDLFFKMNKFLCYLVMAVAFVILVIISFYNRHKFLPWA